MSESERCGARIRWRRLLPFGRMNVGPSHLCSTRGISSNLRTGLYIWPTDLIIYSKDFMVQEDKTKIGLVRNNTPAHKLNNSLMQLLWSPLTSNPHNVTLQTDQYEGRLQSCDRGVNWLGSGWRGGGDTTHMHVIAGECVVCVCGIRTSLQAPCKLLGASMGQLGRCVFMTSARGRYS